MTERVELRNEIKQQNELKRVEGGNKNQKGTGGDAGGKIRGEEGRRGAGGLIQQHHEPLVESRRVSRLE